MDFLRRGIIAAGLLNVAVAVAVPDGDQVSLLFCCTSSNDIYRAVRLLPGNHSTRILRTDPTSCTAAATNLTAGSGVLLLADGAPSSPATLSNQLLGLLHQKDIRLYAEFATYSRTSTESASLYRRTPGGWSSFRMSDPRRLVRSLRAWLHYLALLFSRVQRCLHWMSSNHMCASLYLTGQRWQLQTAAAVVELVLRVQLSLHLYGELCTYHSPKLQASARLSTV